MSTDLAYEHLSRIPAPTWSWLKMNRAALQVGAPQAGARCMTAAGTDGAETESDPARYAELERAFLNAAGTAATPDAQDLFSRRAAETLCVLARGTAAAPVRVWHAAKDGAWSCAKHAVVAEEGAEITVIMDFTSEKDAGGLMASRTLLWAKPRARIHLITVQLLGAGFAQFDGTAALAEDGAEIRVTQVALGGRQTLIDTECTLAGQRATFSSDSAYRCRGEQTLDMNYAVRHTGAATSTRMSAKGVVDGMATKIYRGTIDFRRGCAGATGSEQEETLLLSPHAVSKSIPVMLCDEEDVSGSHGATIGRLGADELFYMQSRGISEQAAKAMMSRAKIAGIARRIPDPALVAEIEAFLDAAE